MELVAVVSVSKPFRCYLRSPVITVCAPMLKYCGFKSVCGTRFQIWYPLLLGLTEKWRDELQNHPHSLGPDWPLIGLEVNPKFQNKSEVLNNSPLRNNSDLLIFSDMFTLLSSISHYICMFPVWKIKGAAFETKPKINRAACWYRRRLPLWQPCHRSSQCTTTQRPGKTKF